MPHHFPRSLRTYAQAGLLLCMCLLLLCVSTLRTYAQAPQNSYAQKIRTFHTAEEFARLTRGSIKIHREPRYKSFISGDTLIGDRAGIVWKSDSGYLRPISQYHLMPASMTTVITGDPNQFIIWIGTLHGAIRYDPKPASLLPVQYFIGQRWLPDNQVRGIGFEDNGNVIWIETPKGFSRIEYKPMTLAEKSKAFVERIRARHVRHGLTA
ncbi:MAG: hypothetical protein L0220_09245, partial [Acidobacteria bacterium]|nr:hypothetical protein [Acidobacteriota bacterium]